MFRKTTARILAALLCAGCLAGTAAAAQTDCDSIYCFTAEDFDSQGGMIGICITALPDDMPGRLMLGERTLVPGDILTQEQVAQMTFIPERSELEQTLQVGYLPIYEGSVGTDTVMTLSIRGRENKAPIAEDFALETYKNLPVSASLKVTDPEGETMVYAVTRQPKRGSVEIGSDGSFTYTPKRNKVGVDSFQFTATDPAGKVSREATVTVTILKTGNAPYTDTQGKNCRFAAEWMKNTGIFVGEQLDGNACFHPDREVTRGEFVAMMVRTLELMEEETADFTGYSDEIPQWLQPYVAAAVRSGLTAGLPDQETFGSDVPISGAEAAVMLQNALDLEAESFEAAAVEDDVPAWAAYALAAMEQSGLPLRANAPLTRGDAAILLYEAANQSRQQEFKTLKQ